MWSHLERYIWPTAMWIKQAAENSVLHDFICIVKDIYISPMWYKIIFLGAWSHRFEKINC